MAVPDIFFHFGMLQDKLRLQMYKNSLQANEDDEDWVEIGTGLGILTAIASRIKKTKVIHTIEYDKSLHLLAKKNFALLKMRNIQSHHCNSFDFSKRIKPSLLFTETIGALGVDENIVELTYDFAQRFKSIKTIIPCRLEIYVQEFNSAVLDQKFKKLMRAYSSFRYENFHLKHVINDLQSDVHSKIFNDVVTDADYIKPPHRLGAFELGLSKTSRLHSEIDLTELHRRSRYLNLYFKAVFSDLYPLHNSVFGPLTHWQHNFIVIDRKKAKILLRYDPVHRQFLVKWK